MPPSSNPQDWPFLPELSQALRAILDQGAPGSNNQSIRPPPPPPPQDWSSLLDTDQSLRALLHRGAPGSNNQSIHPPPQPPPPPSKNKSDNIEYINAPGSNYRSPTEIINQDKWTAIFRRNPTLMPFYLERAYWKHGKTRAHDINDILYGIMQWLRPDISLEERQIEKNGLLDALAPILWDPDLYSFEKLATTQDLADSKIVTSLFFIIAHYSELVVKASNLPFPDPAIVSMGQRFTGKLFRLCLFLWNKRFLVNCDRENKKFERLGADRVNYQSVMAVLRLCFTRFLEFFERFRNEGRAPVNSKLYHLILYYWVYEDVPGPERQAFHIITLPQAEVSQVVTETINNRDPLAATPEDAFRQITRLLQDPKTVDDSFVYASGVILTIISHHEPLISISLPGVPSLFRSLVKSARRQLCLGNTEHEKVILPTTIQLVLAMMRDEKAGWDAAGYCTEMRYWTVFQLPLLIANTMISSVVNGQRNCATYNSTDPVIWRESDRNMFTRLHARSWHFAQQQLDGYAKIAARGYRDYAKKVAQLWREFGDKIGLNENTWENAAQAWSSVNAVEDVRKGVNIPLPSLGVDELMDRLS
ncbi:hypothetical protein NLI96_g4411 [Meripilus lineatus]|uniref:Uncharacterized protein n=1 Tax=Meripilus lineatus TaxID=2056292 RepID=A0AAD5V9Z8_9APHY|nr:hypothetical protein NLI96_g4411 [Physisporinus lineatus]